MPRKPTAHAQLDQLRQQVVAEGVKQCDLEGKRKLAEIEVEQASRDIAAGYAAEDERAIARARKTEEAAVAKVKELEHRCAGAQLRAVRAQQELAEFTRDNVDRLLSERAADARELAVELTRAGHELIRLHRAYAAMRTEIDSLVAAKPGASPREDGPPTAYAWEPRVKDLERAIRQTPEVEPPLPRWHGRPQRRRQDESHRYCVPSEREQTNASVPERDRRKRGGWARLPGRLVVASASPPVAPVGAARAEQRSGSGITITAPAPVVTPALVATKKTAPRPKPTFFLPRGVAG
jgi:hypothetical protein